jgi:hypothetical protein
VLHLGVDEAGYGPHLGPLVIGVAAFRLLDGRSSGVGLRESLRGTVSRTAWKKPNGQGLPVPVDDSKQIHGRYGVPGLARGVGAFASAMGQPPPADLHDLLRRFSDRLPEDYHGVPWYGDLRDSAVPRYPWTGPLEERFRRCGVEALDLRVLPVEAAELNEQFRRVGNKASVLGILSAAVLLSVLDRYPGEDAEVVMDRHGGRLDYDAYLARVFPFARIERREAPRGEALSVVALPGRTLTVRFATRADAEWLSVGWASMAAKLARELFMERINAWFAAKMPGIRMTAGYARDGRRFLADVRDLLTREGIDPSFIARAR